MEIVTREGWGAAPPKSVGLMKKKLDRVFIHWLGEGYPENMTDEQIMQAVQRFHQGPSRNWSDFGYNFAVGRSSRAFEGRGLNRLGGHTFGENNDSYAIVFLIGRGESPTEEMLITATHLIEHIRLNHGPQPLPATDIVVMGHRRDDQASTACPGPELDEWAWEYNHARDYQKDAKSDAAPVTNWGMAVTPFDGLVDRHYKLILGREPDPEGRAYWIQQMNNGLSEVELLREFLGVRLAALTSQDSRFMQRLAELGELGY